MFLSQLLAAATLPLPELKANSRVATAGYYQLEWRVPASTSQYDLQYIVQESGDPRFDAARTLYQGPDLATVLSGRDDGLRYYRVRAQQGDQPLSEWSETLSVETRHHSLPRALFFFTTGAVVFVFTLAMVLRGYREDGYIDQALGSRRDG